MEGEEEGQEGGEAAGVAEGLEHPSAPAFLNRERGVLKGLRAFTWFDFLALGNSWTASRKEAGLLVGTT